MSEEIDFFCKYRSKNDIIEGPCMFYYDGSKWWFENYMFYSRIGGPFRIEPDGYKKFVNKTMRPL